MNVSNCDDSCLEGCSKTEAQTESSEQIDHDKNLSDEITSNNINSNSTNNKKKYAFDVVDDQLDSDLRMHEIEERNSSYDDSHRRIVRVSLQKPTKRIQGACFKGNDSYLNLYDFRKIIRASEKRQSSVNIRFKTSAENGLLFLMYQKSAFGSDYLSLSIEHG